MKTRPPMVRECMTRLPVEAERCASVAAAAAVMDKFEIRHIPVMSGSQLKGVISQRDMLLARIDLGNDVDCAKLEDVCDRNVLTVHSTAGLNEVVEQMLRRKTDCAVVVDAGFVVGILTATDVLKFVRNLFRRSSSMGSES